MLYTLQQCKAAIAQLGERQTEDLKVPGSIPGGGIFYYFFFRNFFSDVRKKKRPHSGSNRGPVG